jgi:hypothetical protein
LKTPLVAATRVTRLVDGVDKEDMVPISKCVMIWFASMIKMELLALVLAEYPWRAEQHGKKLTSFEIGSEANSPWKF